MRTVPVALIQYKQCQFHSLLKYSTKSAHADKNQVQKLVETALFKKRVSDMLVLSAFEGVGEKSNC